MLFSKDMRDLLELLEKHCVEYVLVGGFAVNFYGYVRMTQDIDILIVPSEPNADRVMECISEFGFGGAGIPREAFIRSGSAIHMGVEPNRIDLLTRLKGPSASQVLANSKRIEVDGLTVNIISFDDLIASKVSSERPRDQADVEELRKLQ